jgi:ABC-2 type transport system permease protein
MNAALAIARKELRIYFVSPLFYVVTGLFLLSWGIVMGASTVQNQTVTQQSSFGITSFIMVFLAPLLTMRLISQEKQQGTIELLMTNPVRDVEVVLGKFAAALVMFLPLLGLTFFAVLLQLWTAVDRTQFLFLKVGVVDWGPVFTAYTGNLLLISGYLAIGLFFSSVTQNQIIAAVAGFVVLLGLEVAGFVSQLLTSPVSDALAFISPGTHADNFARGVFTLPDLVLTISVIFVFFLLAVVALGARKWH